MNSFLQEDIRTICDSEIVNWEKFKNKRFFITGGTGLIGSIMVKSLLKKNEESDLKISLLLLVRNKQKAKEMFGKNDNIEYIESDIEDFNGVSKKTDYIIHGASPTKSKFFIERPVETLATAVNGTRNILEYAKYSNIDSMVYLSSMEMYGVLEDDNVTEDKLGYINPLNERSSYSEGKRICELYCYSYFKEYNIPVKIGRIAQTFGAGISKEENRVYKQFADCIIQGKDIVLKSAGNTIINFSYTVDTIIALLLLLTEGNDGEAYNIVSDKSCMTIMDSAKWLIERYGNKNNSVKIDIPIENEGYAPDNRIILSNQKLKKLGWNCNYDLKSGYDRLIKYLIENYNNKE